MTFEEAHALVLLHNQCRAVVDSAVDWEVKYDFIFSKGVSQKVPFEWCDPDTTYEEDVQAFMKAFDENVRNYRVLAKGLPGIGTWTINLVTSQGRKTRRQPVGIAFESRRQARNWCRNHFGDGQYVITGPDRTEEVFIQFHQRDPHPYAYRPSQA